MKKITLFLLLTLSVFSFGQNLEKVDVFNYDEFLDKDFTNKYSDNCIVGTYITEDGSKITKGDTLIIGVPSIFSETREGFRFLVFGSLNDDILSKDDNFVNSLFSDNKIIVEDIKLIIELDYYGVQIKTKRIEKQQNKSHEYITIIDFNLAHSTGEIRLNNAKMLREQTVNSYERKKKLYDLDLISQEEFDQAEQEFIQTLTQ